MPSRVGLPSDGRLARSERSRRAVVDAILDLIEEGDERPTAARIAKRAGVSLRSVFQHFESLESLLAAAADRQLERLAPLMRPIDCTESLSTRLATFVARRARLLEAITPVRRASLREEPRSRAVAENLGRGRLSGRREAQKVFAPEIARFGVSEREEVEAALGAGTSWSTWEALRRHQGLTAARARRVLERLIVSTLRLDARDVARAGGRIRAHPMGSRPVAAG